MATAVAWRIRPPRGPALGRAPLPLGTIFLSVVLHLVAMATLVAAGLVWGGSQPKIYVVNLVPAVAAVGAPQGRPQTPALPPRTEETPAAASRSTDLPRRETSRPSAPELPSRDRASESPNLPERPLPPRPSPRMRAGEKELPVVASVPRPTPAPAPLPRREAATPAPPPPPLGQPSGSTQGSGALTLNVSDFPFAWYLQQVQRKISEKWAGRALEGRQPVAVFEIRRDGQISKPAIEKSSGNPFYDRMALRAIEDATPFPPLPAEFKESLLRVHLGFNYQLDRG